MPSRLFESFGPKPQGPSLPPPFNNISKMSQQFEDFKKQYAGQNPKDIVNNMVASGQMSKEQFEQFGKLANQLQSFMK